MPVSSYGGIDNFFGIVHEMSPDLTPRAIQENAYAGVTGVETIDLGGRGRVTMVRARLVAASVPDLQDLKLTLESFHDGVARDLWDNAGRFWPDVLLGCPKFSDKRWKPGLGGYHWEYTVSLRHLSAW